MSTQTDYPENERPRIYARPCGPSLAKQSSKDECDINIIMAKYAKTGLLEHLNEHKGDYGNFEHTTDFLESQIIVHDAQQMFATIPAGIRKQFDNDPGQFLAFVTNDENHDEMVEMGLANATPKDISVTPPEGSDPPDQATDATKKAAE